jgi:hypothetical protein
LIYHLLSQFRPANKQELFNLCHASARNIIEHIFGVLKRRFRILLLAPEYSLEIQARIPAVLCSIHNFIRTHDDQVDEEGNLAEPDYRNNDNDNNYNAEVAELIPDEPSTRRDQITQQMWDDYVEYRKRNHEDQEDEEEEEGEGEDIEEDDDEV